MRKINLIPLLILGMAVSCTRKQPETLITKWNNKVAKESSFDRVIASSSLKQQQCFKDIFDVQTLKKEVAELEKKYAGGEKVTGTWKHIDLSTLPIPQANFLKTYGGKIGDLKNPESIDYSGCEDVPCIYNRVYKKDNHVAGYVHYIWYLKLGHMLSADNMVPDQNSKTAGIYNGKEIPLSGYLYNDTELFGLWRLSHLLRVPYTNLSYLKETQRIPRGENVEGRPGGVCGVASSAGWVVLNDGCLTVYGQRLDTGYLYQAVTHELAHHVDFESGRGTREFYRSHKKDYLDLIGMWIEEYERDGKQVREWKIKTTANLVSSYAGTLPQENFAETMSLFRVDGELVKRKVISDHYKFVSDNFYESKNFENETLIKNWIGSYKADMEREVLRAVIDCSTESSGSKKSTFFGISDFKYRPSPNSMNCLSSRMEDLTTTLMNKVALFEAEGCGVLTDKTYQAKWASSLKVHLKDILNRYLEEVQVDKDYIARIQDFYSDVEDRTLANESYVSCYKEVNEVACYEETLLSKIKERVTKLKVSPSQEKDLIDLYVSIHPYSAVSSEVKTSYKTFVSSNLEKIRYETDDLWRSCRTGPQNDDLPPKGSIFQVAEGYMVSSLFNCINSSAPDTIKRAVRSLDVDGAKLQNTKEEMVLIDEVKPHVVSMLKEKFEQESMREFNEIRIFIEGEDGSIRSRLISDFSWVRNVIDGKELQKNCESEATRMISFEPLFHIKRKVFSELVNGKICAGISSTPEYKKWVSESQDMFKEMVAKDLEGMLYVAGEERARECLSKYPITNSVSKIKFRNDREACLTNNWGEVERKVLDQLKSNPYVEKFKFSLDEFKTELAGNARRTQLKLIKEHFN